VSPEKLAVIFHEAYERMAPHFGYATRTDTRKFDPTSPNGLLMVAVAAEVLAKMKFDVPDQPQVQEPPHEH